MVNSGFLALTILALTILVLTIVPNDCAAKRRGAQARGPS